MKSTNEYTYPIEQSKMVRMSASESPAHVGKLKHAIDFICPEGTPIKAACDGVVIDIKQDSNKSGSTEEYDKFGNYIEIQHKNDEYSIYEHIKQKG